MLVSFSCPALKTAASKVHCATENKRTPSRTLCSRLLEMALR